MRGWAITAAPVVAVAALQIAFMPWIAAATLGLDPLVEARTVAGLRRPVPAMHAPALGLLAAYWLLAAALCRYRLHPAWMADRLLAAAGLVYSVSHLLGSTMSSHRFALMLCRPFGISATFEGPPYGLDIQTPCEAFALTVGFWLFAMLPLALVGTSLILRIAAARG